MGTSAHSNGPSQPDIEATLLKRRNEKREKRYQSTVASIERCQRKLEKADKTVGRMVRTIAKLERQRKRLANQIENAKPLVYAEQLAEPPKPKKSEAEVFDEKLGAALKVELTESAKRIAKAKKRRDADDFRKDMAAKTK